MTWTYQTFLQAAKSGLSPTHLFRHFAGTITAGCCNDGTNSLAVASIHRERPGFNGCVCLRPRGAKLVPPQIVLISSISDAVALRETRKTCAGITFGRNAT